MIVRPPASLVRYVRDARCVLFCGSGLSAWANLPTWRQLLDEVVAEVASETPNNPDLKELKPMLDAGKLLEVADYCKQALGPRYNEILSARMRGADVEIPEPHQVIAQTPFTAIVTTNYDKLLERSYPGLPKSPTHRDIEALGPLLFDGSFFILKAHGDIDRPDTMVLTARDYQEIIHSNLAFNSLFSAILLTRAVLFVGYSLNDPDFRLLLDRQFSVFQGNVPERYALMSGVGKVERDVLWRTAAIRVLPYDVDQHHQVLEFLQILRDEVRQVPQPRAAATVSSPKTPPAPPIVIAPAARVDVTAPGQRAAARSAPKAAAPRAKRPKATTAQTSLAITIDGSTLFAALEAGDARVGGRGGDIDWARLASLTKPALENAKGARRLGVALAELLPRNIVEALEILEPGRILELRLTSGVELLPWELAVVKGEFLSVRHALARVPASLPPGARGYPAIRRQLRVLLIGDPNREDAMPLPGAMIEVDRIRELYLQIPGTHCTLLSGPAADFDSVAALLRDGGGFDVVHFAGHAWFDEDQESFLFLSGLNKLRATELRTLLSPHPPSILFLNSHFTAFIPPGASGEARSPLKDGHQPAPKGQRGFLDTAASAGVGAFIGSFSGAVADDSACDIGIGVHRSLLKGENVATALRSAVRATELKLPDRPSLLTYVLSGYGDISYQLD